MTEENKRKLAKELEYTPCEATIDVWADTVGRQTTQLTAEILTPPTPSATATATTA